MFLVTGGAGFIGSHLVDALLERGEHVVCLDDFNTFYDPAIKRRNIAAHLQHKNYTLVEGDIRDRALVAGVFGQFRPKRVIHLAARAGVRPSIEEPLLYQDVNVTGTIILLEEARKHGIEQFVFASSSSVYGNSQDVPFREDAPIRQTISPYAASKYSGELMCYTYHHLYKIPTTCLRFFTVYGPRQRPEMAIHHFLRLIHEGKPLPFFGNGQTARDYTYISDILQGILAAIDKPFDFEVFNLGESFCVTLADLVGALQKITSREARLDRLPAQPGDVEQTFADISKARKLLGYNPQVKLENGLAQAFEWLEHLCSSDGTA